MIKDQEYQKWLFERINDISREIRDLSAIVQNPVDSLSIQEINSFNEFVDISVNRIWDWRNDVRVFIDENRKG
jgi:hypothetical protein